MTIDMNKLDSWVTHLLLGDEAPVVEGVEAWVDGLDCSFAKLEQIAAAVIAAYPHEEVKRVFSRIPQYGWRMKAFVVLADRWGRSSSERPSLSPDNDDAYIQYGEGVYPSEEVREHERAEWEAYNAKHGLDPNEHPFVMGSVSVECGVNLVWGEGAQPYYLRDFDHSCDSREFSPPIPWPKTNRKRDWEAWVRRVETVLEGAAEHAYNEDLLSCEECGYHYNADTGGCPCSEYEDEEDE